MEWRDHGIVLSARAHGESAAIVHLLTVAHGKAAGLVRGGRGRTLRGVLEPGNEVAATWRARLEEHLGTLTVEPLRNRAGLVLDDPGRLAALASACAVLDAALPDRLPLPHVHADTQTLLAALETGAPGWPAAYVRWELALLADLGYGLDLTACAATGSTEDLVYVSPKSARAVCREAGEPYKDKLLPLPGFLLGDPAGDALVPMAEIAAGLRLMGAFLTADPMAGRDHKLPAARLRILDFLSAGD